MKHELPDLPYEFNALEPWIDSKTMEIHHDKHHKAYVDKLNSALEGYVGLQEKKVEDLISNLNSVPEKIRNAVRNNGGGHANHSLFWELMTDDDEKKKFEGEIADKIEEEFGNFEEFKKKFSEMAMNRFGSGWVWLVISDGDLEIISTANQDSPIMDGKIPILGLDVWEHAYYLKYQNKRNEYVENWWNVVNWKKANENYIKELDE